nr:hypothetical protein [Lachnospiraceae bacterium]
YGMTASSFAEASVPNEFQEVSNIQLTESFLHSINPYSEDGAFGRDEPGVLYAYGPVYSLITAGLAKVFPVDLILLHYVVSYIAMLAAAFLGAWIVKERTDTLLASATVFCILINCTWRYGYVNAVPDALGFFWMMLVMFIETRGKIKHKELLEIIVIILAFHTKIYMAYIAAPVFVFKLISNRKDAFKFFTYGVSLLVVSSAILTYFCPLIWSYYIYFLHGPFEASVSDVSGNNSAWDVLMFRNTTDPESGLGYEILQLRSIIGMFVFFFAVAAAGVLEHVKNRFRRLEPVTGLLLLDFIVSIPVMYVLGTNDGAWLSYYLQIQIPPLVMFGMIYAEGKCLESRGLLGRVLLNIVLVSMTGFTLLRTGQRLPYYYMLPEQKLIWEDAYKTIEEYSKKGEIYYSPILAFNAEQNGRYYYNNGYVGAASEELYSEYLNTDWEQKMFPYAGDVMKKHLDYRKELEEKIKEGGYELIMVNEGVDGTDRAIRIRSITEGPYILLKEVYMPVSRECFPVRFYVLKD